MKGAAVLTLVFLMMLTTSCFNPTEVKIGVIIPQEGSLAHYGYQISSGIKMAEAEIHALSEKGELKKTYELIFKDEDETNLESIRTAFNELKAEGVIAVIGPASSAGTLALTELANESEIILLSPSSSSPEINSEGGDWVFRNYPSDTLEAQKLATSVFGKMLIKKVLMVRANNTFAEGITYEMLKFGRQGSKKIPNYVLKFDPDPAKAEAEWPGIVDKIVEEKPQGIFMAAYTDELIPLIKEVRSREELKDLYLFTCSAFVWDDVIKALGKEAVENIIFTGYEWDPHENKPEIQAFSEKFRTDYHYEPSYFAATGYDALYILVNAIDGINHSIADEVQDQMNQLEYKSPILGPTDFSKRGDVTRIPDLYWMKDGVKVKITDEDLEQIKRTVLLNQPVDE
jgi:branched-chain amino acid transport system substrate-binding protein